ncbi:MAG: aspartate carbamoyltransferase regulatory subunit [Actinomycetaceae bacterium]|nr:aspartate carbamoyltransferase regulatory subunit [Actinomycetaceae bacterium]
MNIDAIENGIVIDHIPAGHGLDLYEMLELDALDCAVAIIQNAHSNKTGKKDIIKVANRFDLDLSVVGYVAPDAVVNRIVDGQRMEKEKVELPSRIEDVVKCKNPRCITSVEQELKQIFELSDKESGTYRCLYCESEAY